MTKALKEAGFVLVWAKSGHLKVYSQAGKMLCTLPGSPSDYRSILNARTDLRRYAGFQEAR